MRVSTNSCAEPFYLYVADFRQLQFSMQFESTLRIGETIVAMATFESRETGILSALHTLEECFVGLVQTTQGILQDLAEYKSNIRANRFDLWQLVDLIEYANRSTVLPGFDSFL